MEEALSFLIEQDLFVGYMCCHSYEGREYRTIFTKALEGKEAE